MKWCGVCRLDTAARMHLHNVAAELKALHAYMNEHKHSYTRASSTFTHYHRHWYTVLAIDMTFQDFRLDLHVPRRGKYCRSPQSKCHRQKNCHHIGQSVRFSSSLCLSRAELLLVRDMEVAHDRPKGICFEFNFRNFRSMFHGIRSIFSLVIKKWMNCNFSVVSFYGDLRHSFEWLKQISTSQRQEKREVKIRFQR